ncbi:hypothetical protein BU24DRAFT_384353 [Aaosphaeria arxii CBS 175.79]|uniref:CENP-V/GFA domain-containing protein n=1 Tax=Aaosphaeria arxii CBS 175.79 TaxID=1450172 RepID=A0A6A5YB29_9PLEO|nr:uncharacterized protein BU24DRAFT_384353 [Aaosphaeria arxii CBS 175.79]KAF2021980.1 hypothetical protein BU24DRAFT_384353 [Aaosphaeria arxii CBS 175.79]
MSFQPLNGHCTCKAITYTITAPPLITVACHCSWCQRESGSAFVLNTQIENFNFAITSTAQPFFVKAPSPSGGGQDIARCPNCYVALFSHYGGNERATTFVKAGTLDEASRRLVRPEIHIFTSTKAEWVDLEAEAKRGVPVFEGFYELDKVWNKESLQRREDNIKRFLEEEAKKELKRNNANGQ